MKKNNYYVAIMCLLINSCSIISDLYTNMDIYNISENNQDQLFEDYDYMTKVILSSNPHNSAIKEIYNIDVNEVLSANRTKITKETTSADFYDIIDKTLGRIHGHHLFTNSNVPETPLNYTIDSILITKIQSSNQYKKILPTIDLDGYFWSDLKTEYINGKYYNIRDEYKFGDIIPAGSEFYAIDGENIHSYINNELSHFDMAYDLNNNHFSTTSFFWLTFMANEGLHSFSYITPNKVEGKIERENLLFTSEEINRREKTNIYRSSNVKYFNSNRVLYIKLDNMKPELSKSIIDNIKNLSLIPDDIERIIIDIRDNPGGSDNAWLDLITFLTGKEISYTTEFGIKDSSFLRERLPDSYFAGIKKNISFLNNEEFIITNHIEKFQPPFSNLGFKGNIYIVCDNIYSSSGQLVKYAEQNDNLISIGRRTNKFLGAGINPLIFTLPNSKINFSFEPLIDMSNCSKAIDILHSSLEIELNLTIDDFIRLNSFSGDYSSEEYLFKYDPFIIEVLKQ